MGEIIFVSLLWHKIFFFFFCCRELVRGLYYSIPIWKTSKILQRRRRENLVLAGDHDQNSKAAEMTFDPLASTGSIQRHRTSPPPSYGFWLAPLYFPRRNTEWFQLVGTGLTSDVCRRLSLSLSLSLSLLSLFTSQQSDMGRGRHSSKKGAFAQKKSYQFNFIHLYFLILNFSIVKT